MVCDTADMIPMPIEQAILDFYPVEEFTNDNGERMLRVLLVAAARDMVGSALEAVKRAGSDIFPDVHNHDAKPRRLRDEEIFEVGGTKFVAAMPINPNRQAAGLGERTELEKE